MIIFKAIRARMKKTILVMLFAGALLVYAGGDYSARRFISIANSIWAYADHETEKIPAAELFDKGLEYLAGYPWRGDHENPALPKEFNGFRLDLNQDGNKEYFIDIEPFGGSGGPYFIILGKVGKRWSKIGDFQGAFFLLPIKNGWQPIVVVARGGDEIYAKEFFMFAAGKYQKRWTQNFVHGKTTKRSIVKTNTPDKN